MGNLPLGAIASSKWLQVQGTDISYAMMETMLHEDHCFMPECVEMLVAEIKGLRRCRKDKFL
jgi:hypothetical protein